MAQTINNQLMTMKVQNYLDSSKNQLNESSQRIGSGVRVNNAKDDAAGLAIAERMTSLVREMNVGVRNAYDGISMTQVAEGGLDQVSDQLQKMRELAVQSANGSYSDADRANLNAEFSVLNSDISRIAATTEFNGEGVLSNVTKNIDFQVGPGVGADGTISLELVGINSLSVDISTSDAALNSITHIDGMLAGIADSRASFGAVQKRFESTINSLHTSVDTQSAARGRILNADYAIETAMLAGADVMQQTGMAMAVQANTSPQNVLQLVE